MSMTVGDLKKFISGLPDDMQVILQKDSEGNGYSPLAEADCDAIYEAATMWSGAVLSTRWTADDACMSPGEWAEFKANNQRCLVLGPVN